MSIHELHEVSQREYELAMDKLFYQLCVLTFVAILVLAVGVAIINHSANCQ